MEEQDWNWKRRGMIRDNRSLRHTESGGTFVALLYVVFGMIDLACSLLAFHQGFRELNPLLAWLARSGLFLPAKLAMTVGIGILIAVLYSNRVARVAAWSGILIMIMVTAYHVAGLSAAA